MQTNEKRLCAPIVKRWLTFSGRQQPLHRAHKRRNRHRLRQIARRASGADAFANAMIALAPLMGRLDITIESTE